MSSMSLAPRAAQRTAAPRRRHAAGAARTTARTAGRFVNGALAAAVLVACGSG